MYKYYCEKKTKVIEELLAKKIETLEMSDNFKEKLLQLVVKAYKEGQKDLREYISREREKDERFDTKSFLTLWMFFNLLNFLCYDTICL